MNTIDYEQRFIALFTDGSNTPQLIEVYKNLRSLYAQTHRAYHTFEHIKACLQHFDAVSERLDKPFTIELALWFHDVIYDPQSYSNEQDSAVYAALQLQNLNVSEDDICAVYHLIVLTQHPSQPMSDDEKMLIDIDLSILGADEKVFADYETQIRFEYSWVEEAIYKVERVKVLRSFLAQKRIYQTDYFFGKREQQARSNLQMIAAEE